ncbi:MAG: succinyldiaminopimelate transaminase [Sulfuricurvum sp.]|uniref:succinyldiaminopimelate transaminase n=1 Tax=Sulfuricurvum sp. TaxID=2025608 RepID=UPI0025EC6C92|nr:succinyldiaminopimelate transaminase [Sulfuricurvum sp.]MCK9373765.1 succinyldiaminopimelate transaminase [Sulfuricurvum sp.]
MHFEPYPFEKLTALLEGITPNSDYSPIALTIGEPQFETPAFIQKSLCKHSEELRRYPKTAGESYLNESMRGFVATRFGVELKPSELISTFGTREVLFNFPQFYLFDTQNPVMAYTNPFYQIYEGSAIASRARVIHLNLTEQNSFKPVVDEAKLAECDLVILNFPNNPTASVLSLDELGEWVKLALKHDFCLINDECYSEIYTAEKVPSLLEASIHVGNRSFKNVLVINSISKRSSAPGLRSGFIAGDAEILKGYAQYRTYVGCASPLPLQAAAAMAWADDVHVQAAREVYAQNFKAAREILGVESSDATFYLWLKVSDPLEFTRRLYRDYNVKVLPGEFLAREDSCGENPGIGYLRIALVEETARTIEALHRLKEALQ